jgi:hypothetical protein
MKAFELQVPIVVQAALARAVEAAGERAVTVVGADLNRQLLAAGLGRRVARRRHARPARRWPAAVRGNGPLALEKLGVDEVGARTSLRFRVASAAVTSLVFDAAEGRAEARRVLAACSS